MPPLIGSYLKKLVYLLHRISSALPSYGNDLIPTGASQAC